MFSRDQTEQMGKALSVYGFGLTLGCILAGLCLPFVAGWLIPSYELILPAYPHLAISVVQMGIMAGFAWGALCGWLSGIFADPNIMFNRRPKLSRLLGAFFVIVPGLIIPLRLLKQTPPSPSALGGICLVYMAWCWLSVGLISLYFIDRDPFLSRYKCYLSELTQEQLKNL